MRTSTPWGGGGADLCWRACRMRVCPVPGAVTYSNIGKGPCKTSDGKRPPHRYNYNFKGTEADCKVAPPPPPRAPCTLVFPQPRRPLPLSAPCPREARCGAAAVRHRCSRPSTCPQRRRRARPVTCPRLARPTLPLTALSWTAALARVSCHATGRLHGRGTNLRGGRVLWSY